MTFAKTSSTLRLALGATALTLIAGAAQADQVILDDLIVDGSLCVGFDCVNGESFGFDTIRMKENNIRIKAQDTSNSASFPTFDWQLTFNETSNGGANKFSIDDIDSSRTPFTIEGAAPNHSLYVDSSGNIGLTKSNPVVELHIVDGDTPTIRLEQDGSSGFTPQTWDMAGNETNYFIRDATNGSKLPFRIRPNAPTSSIDVEGTTGDVGLGTASPSADLHVVNGGGAFTADAATVALFQNNAAAGDVARITILAGNTGVGQLAFGDADNEFAGRIRYFHSDNHMDFLVNGTVEALRVFDGTGANVLTTATSAAVLTSAGVWQDASSRTLKQNIVALSSEDAMRTLEGLEPVTFNYIKEPGETTVGFIAEDVPDLVATESRKTLSSLDIVAVLTKVVQEQNARIEAQGAEIEELRAAISAQ